MPDTTELELGKTAPIKQPQAITKPLTKRDKPEPKEMPAFEFKLQSIRYRDVIGMSRQKAILHKLLELPLRKPQEFESFNIRKSVGIILYGPPGTGKTFIAKACCGELNIRMCYVKVSNIMSKYVGESAQRVKEVFIQAHRSQPCAVFIDEADILLQNRDEISNEGGSNELKQAVSQMLQEVSEVHDDRKSHIYLLAATNQPWNIDMAHKRSGRFEYLLYVRPPNFMERYRMFKLYLDRRIWAVFFDGKYENFSSLGDADAFVEKVRKEANMVISKEIRSNRYGNINFFLLALASASYSPADIEKICKVAKINAIEKKKVFLTTRSVQKALWSKEAGKSSLDDWYVSMYVKYLPKRRSILRSMMSKKYRQKEDEKVKFDKADIQLYEPMIKDIKHHMRDKWFIKASRVFGRGFPIVYS